MVCPATVTVPLRWVGPFGKIKSETMVVLPGGKLGRIMIHVAFETAVHEHELAVATDSVAPPPAPDTDNEVGDTAYVQDGATVLPQRTSAAAHAMTPARRTARGIGNLHARSYAGSVRGARARNSRSAIRKYGRVRAESSAAVPNGAREAVVLDNPTQQCLDGVVNRADHHADSVNDVVFPLIGAWPFR
jgi:hypothetical protein